jgi:hypothetical protein
MMKQPAKESFRDLLTRRINHPAAMTTKHASKTNARLWSLSEITPTTIADAAPAKKIGIVRAWVVSTEYPKERRMTGRKPLKLAKVTLMQEYKTTGSVK